ncbi:MAG: AAA family ATPase [Candidatus Omnitrophica bacterium]|nr:AAA family ATPase [Candidatus Omnitrophota bacterium]
MKIAFTGKGGVGKTTLASIFVNVLSKEGEVLAIDCDPDSNLARNLGFGDAEKIKPIVKMEDMINKRMGVEKGKKSFYKLNPKIDDIPDKFSRTNGNVKLIVMGAVKEGGAGCMCPENAFVKNLISHLVLKRDENLVMDMEAGLEHFGRGTAEGCNFVLAVVEPSLNSIQTAKNVNELAKDIGVKKVYAIGNKVRTVADKTFIEKELGKIKLIETIDFDEELLKQDKYEGFSVVSKKISTGMEKIKNLLKEELS